MLTRDESNGAMAFRPDFALPVAGNLDCSARMNPRDDSAPGTETIRDLTLAVRRGDADAFSRFYDLYSFRLYKYLLVLTRGNENEAREVCQQVFIKLSKRLPVFDDERKLWGWLCTLAKNSFIDHCRAQRRRGQFVPFEESPPEPARDGHSILQLSEVLREVLAGLPPEDRELIQAVHVDERPLQELADESGQTYKAVESRLGRLRQRLKQQLLKRIRHENES